MEFIFVKLIYLKFYKRNKIKDKNYKQIFIFNFIKIYIIFNFKYFRKIEYFLIYIKINFKKIIKRLKKI